MRQGEFRGTLPSLMAPLLPHSACDVGTTVPSGSIIDPTGSVVPQYAGMWVRCLETPKEPIDEVPGRQGRTCGCLNIP